MKHIKQIFNDCEKNNKLIAIVYIGFIIRIIALIFYPDQNFLDAQGYARDGKIFFETGVFPAKLHMPLYIIWTHLMGNALILKITDIIFSCITIIIIYKLTFILFKNKKSALLASLIAAIYPHFIFYSISRLTETSFTLFFLLGLLNIYNRRIFLASLCWIISILIRPTFDLIYPILVILFAWYIHKLPIKTIGKWSLIYTALYLIIFTPWWIHNYKLYGTFIRLNLGDGYVLYSGNNPLNKTGGGVVSASVKDLDMQIFSHITDPVEFNNALKNYAIAYIANNPSNFIKLAAIKFIRFWRLWPFAKEYQSMEIILISIFSYGPVLIGFLIAIFTMHKKNLILISPLLIVILYLMLVHMILISSIRYRFPIEPLLIIIGSYLFPSILNYRTEGKNI